MSRSQGHEHFPDDLRDVADALRDQRPALDPLALDRIKTRAISGARRATAASSRPKGILMRSRLATFLTIAFFGLGTGAAVALVGHEDFGLGGGGGSASFNQYRECDDNGQGDDNNQGDHNGQGNHNGRGNGNGPGHECQGDQGDQGHGQGDQGEGGNGGQGQGNDQGQGDSGKSGAAHQNQGNAHGHGHGD
jgi:hypothetical protein